MANKIIGTDGNNQLLGTSGDDIMKGLGGADYLYGAGGADRLIGGKGDDALDGSDGDGLSDTLLGGGGDDRIGGGSGDRLDGGVGEDFFSLFLQNATSGFKLDLTGLTKGGTLVLKDGTVVKNMESGQMTLGSGADKVTIGDAHVAVYAGAGDDTLIGGALGDTLGAGMGDDSVNGGNGSDWVSYQGAGSAVHVDLAIQGEAQDTGGGGMDTLVSIENLQGSGNDDTLIGDGHANSIQGSAGADTMTGGGGADTFVFASAGESYAVAADQITDLTNSDIVDVHGIDADTSTLGNQDFTIVASFTHHAGQAILWLDGDGNTRFEMDTNGDGSADEGIIFQGDHRDFHNFVL